MDGGLAAAAQLLSVEVAAAARAASFQLGDVAGLAHAPCWLPPSGLQVQNRPAASKPCQLLPPVPSHLCPTKWRCVSIASVHM